MKKVVLIFGVIGGLIVSSLMFLTLGSGEINFENGELIGYATMIIALSTIFFAVKSYRDKYADGTIKFGKAFLIGLYVTLITSAMYVGSWMIISSGSVGDDFMNQYQEHMLNGMVEQGIPQAEIDTKMVEFDQMKEMYKKPIWKIVFTLMEILPVGLLVSLICAAILMRNKNKKVLA